MESALSVRYCRIFKGSVSGTGPNSFPDCLPWLFVCGGAGLLPWAAHAADKRATARPIRDCENS